MKINITMNDELLERLDKHAKELYTTRSGLISLACVQYLNQQEAMNLIRVMSTTMQRIAETGTIDDEAQRQIDDFERIVKLMNLN